jgi:hypothetical protein
VRDDGDDAASWSLSAFAIWLAASTRPPGVCRMCELRMNQIQIASQFFLKIDLDNELADQRQLLRVV